MRICRFHKGKGAILAAAILLVVVAGCSEENPANVTPDEVADDYSFSRFEFIPLATAVAPANILDTLITANSFLKLTQGGQFLLNYQFTEGPESIIAGNFSLTATQVKLMAAAGSEARLAPLLLDPTVHLDRIPEEGQIGERLELSIVKTADLSKFSDRYQGLPPLQGRLEIILTPR